MIAMVQVIPIPLLDKPVNKRTSALSIYSLGPGHEVPHISTLPRSLGNLEVFIYLPYIYLCVHHPMHVVSSAANSDSIEVNTSLTSPTPRALFVLSLQQFATAA